ncbi:MAG: hypothetical protein M1305_02280 [Candidatus Marsarchaeota archaeon]|nr:hypothetical protein [Candidatus Marsarchaeota archaeon]
MVLQSVSKVDASLVKSYARDLHSLLEESELTERKAFLRALVDKITVNKDKVTVRYRLPIPNEGKDDKASSVLPIDTFGGAEGIRPPDSALRF